MKKHMLNHQKEPLFITSESRLLHLNQKGMESGHHGYSYMEANGHMILGLWMASKVPRSIYVVEPGKPNALPEIVGRKSARMDEGVGGRAVTRSHNMNCREATPSVWSNPTEACVGSNAGVMLALRTIWRSLGVYPNHLLG